MREEISWFSAGFLVCVLIVCILRIIPEPSVPAPSDWINESQINIISEFVCIYGKNGSISNYAPSGSMKPTFDTGANGIRIVPSSPEQIEVGDIVTWGDNIVHRVIQEGIDGEDYWYITKGDNSPSPDNKIRFSDIKYVTIGILY